MDAALQALRKGAPDDMRSVYGQGALLRVEGKGDEAEPLLRKSLQASDSFVQYLSLATLLQAPPK
jgi:hypothetical protein